MFDVTISDKEKYSESSNFLAGKKQKAIKTKSKTQKGTETKSNLENEKHKKQTGPAEGSSKKKKQKANGPHRRQEQQQQQER